MDDKLSAMCKWLKEEKGITKIDMLELAEYLPEYEKWAEEQEQGWTTDLIKCDLCSFEWVAVYHEDTDKLQCPQCKNMTIINE